VKIDARLLVLLYPRAWRERYGEEFQSLLEARVRPRDIVDIFCGAASEWMVHMTGNGYWNDQAQRTTRALAQAAGAVILFQTFVPPIVSVFIGTPLAGSPHLWMAVVWGFVSSLLQCCVTLGPVALAVAPIPWRNVPYARVAATMLAAIIAFRISSHIAWGPVALALVLGAIWIGYRTVSIEREVVAPVFE